MPTNLNAGGTGAAQDAAAPGGPGPAPPPAAGIARLTVGQRDPNGSEVTCVFAATDNYVIYLADDQVRFILPAAYDEAKAMRQRIAALGGLRASIEDLRSETCIGELDRTRAARELAWALGDAFEDDGATPSDQPKQVLVRVDDRLRGLVKSHDRKKYVLANLLAFAIIEVALCVVAADAARWPGVLVLYARYGMLGGLGAFLSVIAGIRSIEFDVDLRSWEHVFAGATRILIGVIGAWVVGLALDSALLDPTFGHRGDAAKDAAAAGGSVRPGGFGVTDAMYFVLALIGGFSETLVPNLLRRGEDQAGAGGKPDPAPDGPIVKDMKP